MSMCYKKRKLQKFPFSTVHTFVLPPILQPIFKIWRCVLHFLVYFDILPVCYAYFILQIQKIYHQQDNLIQQNTIKLQWDSKMSGRLLFFMRNANFQLEVALGKSAAMPLSFWLHLATDQTFQMRYIMSPNSKWFQTYRPSKFKAWEKVCLSKDYLTQTNFFLILPNLTAGHF